MLNSGIILTTTPLDDLIDLTLGLLSQERLKQGQLERILSVIAWLSSHPLFDRVMKTVR